VLEESESDVLLLLDCCHAGTANTNEGNGSTEIISACPYNSSANGVGPYSFTQALVTELENLSRKAEFSTGELYNNIYCRTQIRLPDDGAGTERHPPPIHLVLSNDSKYRRSIHLAKRPSLDTAPNSSVPSEGNDFNDASIPESLPQTPLEAGRSPEDSSSIMTRESALTKEVPRLAFAIRFKEDLHLDDSTADLFLEWLRTMPVVAQQVRVEAGFESFSSLLIVSIPISLFAYLPYNPAVICLGPITSSNRIGRDQRFWGKPPAAESKDNYGLSGVANDEQPSEHTETVSYSHNDSPSAELGPTPLERRNSNAPSMTSSISTVTSAASETWLADTLPQSRSPDAYSPQSPLLSLNERDDEEYPASLKEFGDRLNDAGSNIFPLEVDITYSSVSSLILSWEGENAQLSDDVVEFADLLSMSFGFEVEHFIIPFRESQAKITAKITQFLQDESPSHLKILYYGGEGRVYADGRSEWRR